MSEEILFDLAQILFSIVQIGQIHSWVQFAKVALFDF